jgi:hypothetical protein
VVLRVKCVMAVVAAASAFMPATASARRDEPRTARVALAPGFSTVVPAGWSLRGEQLTDCAGAWQLLAATSYAGAWKDLPATGALVVVRTTFAIPGTPVPPCRPPLRRRGSSFAYDRDGHAFHAYVYVGTRASVATQREAAALLEALRVDGRYRVAWARSRSWGTHTHGTLAGAVRLPRGGRDFFTWDPVRRRTPNRAWRRWGATSTVARVLEVVRNVRLRHPGSPRIGIGDLSRPRGGDFGPRFGGLGHVSHQNGLDVDVYYPRRDGREAAPRTVAQVDLSLSQALVDGFVRAGAAKIFVGPNVRLRGPRRIVQVLPNHDNHLHVRFGDA